MSDQTKGIPRMTGLFAGIFSSADGTWVPMPQLRRFSSVGAWALSFGMTVYGVCWLVERSGVLNCIGVGELCLLGIFAGMVLFFMIVAVVSFFWGSCGLEAGSSELNLKTIRLACRLRLVPLSLFYSLVHGSLLCAWCDLLP